MEKSLFILDEHIPLSVGRALEQLGFQYATVSDALGRQTSDRDIVLWADKHRATIVTQNWRDFEKYIGRRPLESPNRFRFAGLFCVNCVQRLLPCRIAQVGYLIQSECSEALGSHDCRIFLDMNEHSVKFIR